MRALLDRLITFRVARRMCANSAYGAELLRGLGCDPAKISVIRNGIDLAVVDGAPAAAIRAELAIPAAAPLVGTVSRLIWYKGVDTLIRAMAHLPPVLDAHLLIVGDGPDRPALGALAVELGIANRIHFAGMRPNAEAIMREVDVATLATRTTEHCSNSILEYMASGRPVIATRALGGNTELVIAGETGLLVDVDDVPAFASALSQLLTRPDEAARMGREGRRRIEEEGSMERVADEFLQLCRDVVTAA